MTQITIAEIIEQISQEIEVDANGQAKASVRATARLDGVDDESIRKALKSSADLEPPKLAQMLMQQGFEAADLTEWRTAGIPDIAIAIILEYYAYDAGRYCTLQTRLVCRLFLGDNRFSIDTLNISHLRRLRSRRFLLEECFQVFTLVIPSHLDDG